MDIDYIELKPETKTIKLGEYGEFTVRKFGAGESLKLAEISREIEEMQDNIPDLEKLKDKPEQEILDKLSEAVEKVHALQKRQLDIIKAVVSCDDEARIAKLFDEISFVKLFETIGKVARG